MGAAVEVRGLRVVRGRTTALAGVDLDVAAGTVTGLLGPSGSGKTTLMRCVLGVQRVAAGRVTVLGRPAGSRELRRRIGYVTQAPSVYPDLTAEENLRYFARVLGVDRRARGVTTVAEALDVVGLAAQRRQLVGTLSGGQLSRVSLAAALLGSPELLVLDEPTVGLDPVLRESLWATFREIAGTGTTLLVSSHVMDEAARCDELVLLRAGHILARTTLPELLRRTGERDGERAFLRLVRDAAPVRELP
ncbi:ABC transporter ATP-binding protein [Georgenia thermotolerans]|uniref:ATP-binding cassette domain-containing protein n=1 Tax=Georgenia thermotolerans TaxID=527326 RepID=A0A7J5URT0_9MICO|nr:ABC transporter ATP-binding protein [Georgenia thermotolerans]KAE8764940.1 ATP-binding cassette domain-containing protein [Georgenia thermotolerans]